MTFGQSVGLGAFGLLVVTVLVGLAQEYRRARSRGASLGEAIFEFGVFFSLAYLVYFVCEPLLILGFEVCASDYVAALPVERRIELVGWASAFALLGYVGFLVGLRSRWAVALGTALPYLRIGTANRSWRRVLLAGLCLAACIGLSRYNFVRLLAEPHMRVEINAGMGYWFALVQLGLVATQLVYLDHMRHRRGSSALATAMWLAPLGLVIFGSRTFVLSAWLVLTGIRVHLGPRLGLPRIVAIFCALLLFLGGYLVYRRASARSQRLDAPVRAEATSVLERLPAAMHFALYPYDAFLVYLDLYEGHFADRIGSGLYEMLTYVVPRSLHPDRPQRAEDLLRELIAPDASGGNPFTLVGYFHLNFSYVGVLLGMLILGFLAGTLGAYLQAHPTEESVVLLYAFAVSTVVPLLVGAFLPWFLGNIRLLLLYLGVMALLGPVAFPRREVRVAPGGLRAPP